MVFPSTVTSTVEPSLTNRVDLRELPWVSSNPEINSPEWEQARKVREALVIAIDRQLIVDTILRGEGKPLVMWGWENNLHRLPPELRQREYNPERARQLLVEAGPALVLGRWHLKRKPTDIGGNFSLVFRQIEDRWVIIHDHTSRTPEPSDTDKEPS